MSNEQQSSDPLPYRSLANPRRQRASAARQRQPVVGASDRRDELPDRSAAATD
jgi:hypothetical protein